jgi:hypothetical protein
MGDHEHNRCPWCGTPISWNEVKYGQSKHIMCPACYRGIRVVIASIDYMMFPGDA